MRIRIAIDGLDISWDDFRNLISRNKKPSRTRGVGFSKKISISNLSSRPKRR